MTPNLLWFMELSAAPLSLVNALLLGVILQNPHLSGETVGRVESILNKLEIVQVETELGPPFPVDS